MWFVKKQLYKLIKKGLLGQFFVGGRGGGKRMRKNTQIKTR